MNFARFSQFQCVKAYEKSWDVVSQVASAQFGRLEISSSNSSSRETTKLGNVSSRSFELPM